MDTETLNGIRGNTKLVIDKLGPNSGIAFGLNRPSVEWLEGFISRQRASGQDTGGLVSVLGSFLGDAIIAAAGGEWSRGQQGDVGIRFVNNDWCFPFAKVAKQFENGVEGGDGILGFYDTAIKLVATGKLRQQT